jgi:hypothetical protein
VIQPENDVVFNSQRSVSIQESKEFFQRKQDKSIGRFEVNQNDWQGLEPAWGAANEVILNDSSTVVLVPIADSVIMIDPFLDAYVVFFEDSLSEIQMHVLFFQADTTQYLTDSFPSISNFSGLIWEFYDEEDTYGVTVVEDGVISGCGCSSVFGTYIDTVTIASILPRTKAPKCPRWKNNIWEWIAGAAGDVWKVVKGFFKSIQSNGGSGSIAGTGSTGGAGGTGGTGGAGGGGGTGGTGGGGGSGFDGFGGFGFGGNGGGGGNNVILNLSSVFTEWQLKQMLQAAIWMNDTYGTNWDVNDLYASMDLNCIWEISDFIQNPGGGPVIGDENEGPACATSYYLGDVLGLTSEEIQCISTSQNIADEIYQLFQNNNILDVCDFARTSEDILGNAISNACQSNGISSMDELYSVMAEEEKILIVQNFSNSCPKYYCVFEAMMNGPFGSELVCDILSGFDEDTESPLFVRAFDFSIAQNYNPSSVAVVEVIGGTVNLTINTKLCNAASSRFAFETLQHELVHADIQRRLLEDYNWNGNGLTYLVALNQLAYEIYGEDVTPNEHAIMIQHYLDIMIDGLIQMNGGVGTYDDFVGLVLTGFPPEVYTYINLTTSDVMSLYYDYLNATTGQGNINNVLINCD